MASIILPFSDLPSARLTLASRSRGTTLLVWRSVSLLFIQRLQIILLRETNNNNIVFFIPRGQRQLNVSVQHFILAKEFHRLRIYT